MQQDKLQSPFEVPILSLKSASDDGVHVVSADDILSAPGNAKALIQFDMAVVSSQVTYSKTVQDVPFHARCIAMNIVYCRFSWPPAHAIRMHAWCCVQIACWPWPNEGNLRLCDALLHPCT